MGYFENLFSFRARAGAAPLKQSSPLPDILAMEFIPRPRGRGPVEAFRDGARLADSLSIPRPRGRGPVEACPARHRLAPAGGIPRPRGRGPVEAVALRNSPNLSATIPRPRGRGPVEALKNIVVLPSRCSFRARAGAAPLKHDVDAQITRPV